MISKERLRHLRELCDTPREVGREHQAAQSELANAVPELLDEVAILRTLAAEVHREAVRLGSAARDLMETITEAAADKS